MEILGADLKDGLLSIDLVRPQPERIVRKIDIRIHDDATADNKQTKNNKMETVEHLKTAQPKKEPAQ
jgi:hypothetical protein